MAAKITPAPLTRTLAEVAKDIREDYRSKGKPVYFAAVPYVDVLAALPTTSLNGFFYDDAMDGIVIRLLGNLSTWRGETATRVKAELKAAVNHHNVSQGKRPIY